VEFKRIPAVFQDSWLPFARLYYTLEALGLVEKLHHQVFEAVHTQKIRLQEPSALFAWAASKGVDRQKFVDTYNSFSVQSLTQRAKETTGRYGIPFTPALVIDGRYLTGPSMTSPGNEIAYDRFFQVVDQMIAGVRKKAAAR
jgi:thiol:disulfide interchange protein DsbA